MVPCQSPNFTFLFLGCFFFFFSGSRAEEEEDRTNRMGGGRGGGGNGDVTFPTLKAADEMMDTVLRR